MIHENSYCDTAPRPVLSGRPPDAIEAHLRDALPAAMLQAKRWLIWKSIPNEDPDKPPRKVPYYCDRAKPEARRGALDTPADLERLVTFSAALAALQSGDYAGLGFALGPDGTGRYWQGIDLDKIALHPGLELLRDDLPGYTEASPSGTGVHAIGYGLWFNALASNGSGIEAYASGRYFTVTGDEAGLGELVCLESFVRERLVGPHGAGATGAAHGAGAQRAAPIVLQDGQYRDLRSALFFLPSDEYARWIECGLALHCLGDVGRSLWFEWSELSPKFDPSEAARKWPSFASAQSDYRKVFNIASAAGWANPAKRKAPPARGGDLVELKEVRKKKAKGASASFTYQQAPGSFDCRPEGAPGLDEDSSHHALAVAFLAEVPKPGFVYCEGALWRYAGEIWERVPESFIEIELGGRYEGFKQCKRKSDYSAIRRHIDDLCRDEAFFDLAPLGLMAGGEFWRPDGDGIQRCSPSPELRQRYRVPFAPDFDHPYPRFRTYLDRTFAHDDSAVSRAQIDVLQESLGSILLGGFYRYEKALYLYGRARAGKSVLLRLLEGLLPSELIGSVSPFDWPSDYHRAALAGIRVNVVGELPNDKPIPAAEFKAIIGRDRIAARNPYGRPFSFRPTAAHLFNSNSFICTKDQHPAFFDRWLILHFQNTVPPDERDPELVTRILQEEGPALLAWALAGAQRLLKQGGRFTQSPAQSNALERWRCASDSVRAFIEECTKHQAGAIILRGDAYKAYREYCDGEVRRAVGRNNFYQRVDDIGVFVGKNTSGDWVIYDRALVSK